MRGGATKDGDGDGADNSNSASSSDGKRGDAGEGKSGGDEDDDTPDADKADADKAGDAAADDDAADKVREPTEEEFTSCPELFRGLLRKLYARDQPGTVLLALTQLASVLRNDVDQVPLTCLGDTAKHMLAAANMYMEEPAILQHAMQLVALATSTPHSARAFARAGAVNVVIEAGQTGLGGVTGVPNIELQHLAAQAAGNIASVLELTFAFVDAGGLGMTADLIRASAGATSDVSGSNATRYQVLNSACATLLDCVGADKASRMAVIELKDFQAIWSTLCMHPDRSVRSVASGILDAVLRDSDTRPKVRRMKSLLQALSNSPLGEDSDVNAISMREAVGAYLSDIRPSDLARSDSSSSDDDINHARYTSVRQGVVSARLRQARQDTSQEDADMMAALEASRADQRAARRRSLVEASIVVEETGDGAAAADMLMAVPVLDAEPTGAAPLPTKAATPIAQANATDAAAAAGGDSATAAAAAADADTETAASAKVASAASPSKAAGADKATSAATAAMAVATEDGPWVCAICTNDNDATATECQSCTLPRAAAASPSPRRRVAAVATSATAATADSADSAAPATSPVAAPAPAPAPASSATAASAEATAAPVAAPSLTNWKCIMCDNSNEPELTNCARCTFERPPPDSADDAGGGVGAGGGAGGGAGAGTAADGGTVSEGAAGDVVTATVVGPADEDGWWVHKATFSSELQLLQSSASGGSYDGGRARRAFSREHPYFEVHVLCVWQSLALRSCSHMSAVGLLGACIRRGLELHCGHWRLLVVIAHGEAPWRA